MQKNEAICQVKITVLKLHKMGNCPVENLWLPSLYVCLICGLSSLFTVPDSVPSVLSLCDVHATGGKRGNLSAKSYGVETRGSLSVGVEGTVQCVSVTMNQCP